jgi:hypothetical protein
LLLAATAMMVTRAHRPNTVVHSLTFVVSFILAFVPVQGLPIAGYLRGVIGDLSVTSWILLVTAVVSKVTDRELHRPKSFTALMALILISGLVLYPSALGVSYLDTYALGYAATSLIAVFFLLSLAAWLLEYRLVTVCLTASVLAYSLRIFESRNLWDYWIDPLATIYALFGLSALWWKRCNILRWGQPDADNQRQTQKNR